MSESPFASYLHALPASQESSEEEGTEENEEVDEMETTDRSGARRMLHHDLTSGELYQTAEIECSIYKMSIIKMIFLTGVT